MSKANLTKRLHGHFTENEAKAVRKAAEAADRSVSSFLRLAALRDISSQEPRFKK